MTNDPWVALGTLIGTALGQGYKNHTRRRDNEKVDEYLAQQQNSQAIQDIQKDTKEQIAQQIVNADPNQQLRQNVSTTPQLVMNGNNLETQYKPFTANMYDKPQQEPLQKAVADIANLKAAADMRNIQKQADMTPQQRADYNFNRALTPDAFKAWARQNISKDAYEARLPEVKNAIARSAGAAMLPEINRNLYGYTDEKGNRVAPTQESIINGLAQIQELSAYDPDTAKELKALANGQRNYVQQAADKEYWYDKQAKDKEYWYNKQRQDRLSDMQYAASLRGSSGGGGGGGGTPRVDRADTGDGGYGKTPMFNGQVITPTMKDDAQKRIDATLTEYGSESKIPPEKKKDYDNDVIITKRFRNFEDNKYAQERLDNLDATFDKSLANPDIVNNYAQAVGPNGIFQQYLQGLIKFGVPESEAKAIVQQKLAGVYGNNSDWYGDWSDMNGLASFKDAQRQKEKYDEGVRKQMEAIDEAEAVKRKLNPPEFSKPNNTLGEFFGKVWRGERIW